MRKDLLCNWLNDYGNWDTQQYICLQAGEAGKSEVSFSLSLKAPETGAQKKKNAPAQVPPTFWSNQALSGLGMVSPLWWGCEKSYSLLSLQSPCISFQQMPSQIHWEITFYQLFGYPLARSNWRLKESIKSLPNCGLSGRHCLYHTVQWTHPLFTLGCGGVRV